MAGKVAGERCNNRDKILECAREMFYREGYQVTSVDRIIERCGVAKSNFYYHFKTKEDLAFAVLDQRIDEYQRILSRTLSNRELPPPVRLTTFCEHVCKAQAEAEKMAGCPFGNLAATLATTEEDDRHERLRQRLSVLFREVEKTAQDCFAEGIAQGDFRNDVPPTGLACLLVATVQGLMILTKTYRDAAPLVSGLAIFQTLLRCDGKPRN